MREKKRVGIIYPISLKVESQIIPFFIFVFVRREQGR
jgi:hypothetical protein